MTMSRSATLPLTVAKFKFEKPLPRQTSEQAIATFNPDANIDQQFADSFLRVTCHLRSNCNILRGSQYQSKDHNAEVIATPVGSSVARSRPAFV